MMKLSAREKSVLAVHLREYCEEEFDTDLGQLQSGLFVDFLAREFGPVFYNRGLRDAQTLLLSRLDDVADSILSLEQTA